MLPANVGIANQTPTKRELPIAMKLGSGGVASTLTVTPSVNGQSKGQEELRYLPIATMPSKPCSITISNYTSNGNSNNNNNINNSNNSNNVKTKLTPVNIVQKQLRVNNSAPPGTTPFIQLMAANPNGNGNSLLSILTPKAIINPSSNNNSNNTNNNSTNINTNTNNKTQPHPLPQSQPQLQPVMIRPATTLTTIPVQQQNGAAVYNNNSISSNSSKNNNCGKGASAALTLVGNKTGKSIVKTLNYIMHN